MGQVNLPSNILDRVKRLETQLAEIRKAIGLSSATIINGDLTLKGNANINLPPGGHIRDGVGNILFSADGHTGQRLSTPFIPVPMYPEFENRTTGNGLITCLASDIGTVETNVWEGVIPQVVAPQIMWKFVGGDASSNTVTVTYRLYVNGDLIDSFSANDTTLHQTDENSLLDITASTIFGSANVQVVVTAQCSVSNADQIWCQMLSVAQCGR